MKLLVVDDNSDLLDMLASALEDFGHTVDRAGDGRFAVELQANNIYDCVITDAAMPRLDGIQLCKFIRANFPHVRIIGMSGSSRLKEFENAGADVCLSKPFSLSALRDAIEEPFSSIPAMIDR
jgi:CheY-like chemotaxis protein